MIHRRYVIFTSLSKALDLFAFPGERTCETESFAGSTWNQTNAGENDTEPCPWSSGGKYYSTIVIEVSFVSRPKQGQFRIMVTFLENSDNQIVSTASSVASIAISHPTLLKQCDNNNSADSITPIPFFLPNRFKFIYRR